MWKLLVSWCKGDNYAIIIINDFHVVVFHCDISNDTMYDIQFEYKIEILSLNSLF